jgi:ribosome assembly protein YihI (activator of Der GTPase)
MRDAVKHLLEVLGLIDADEEEDDDLSHGSHHLT